MRYFSLRTTWILTLSCLAMACEGDYEATIAPLSEPIAVGAHFPLKVSDACRGGGKVSVCTSEEVVSIDGISVGNPRVAEVMRMEELTEALQLSSAELVVEAKSPGQTSVAIDSTFDDDSQRRVETTVRVEQADSIDLVHSCPVGEPQDIDLFPAQTEIDLRADLLHESTRLLGEHMNPLITGDGVARLSGLLTQNSYRWTSPDTAGTTTITSSVIKGFSVKYRTYERAQLSIDSIEPVYDLSKAVQYDNYIALAANLTVGGKRPCKLVPLQLESLSPEICGGRGGVTTWSDDSEWNLSVVAFQTGTCQLVASIEGTETTYPFEFDIIVEAAPPVYVNPCQDVVCATPVGSCPDGTELATRNCCNECVPVPDAALCATERATWDPLYASKLAGSTSCTFDTDCSTTVLIGGCRRYCYIPLDSQQITPFMNAVSEAYYTGCRHCVVENPATCETRPPIYCDAGQCRFGP